MKKSNRNGSALILALLMTSVILSCALYAWHMASFAHQLARTQYVAQCYEQGAQGLLAYAITIAKEYYATLRSPAQEHTKDIQFTLARFLLLHDHEINGHVLFEGHKEYVRIVATLLDKEKVCCRASCAIREEKRPDKKVAYVIDGFTLQAT